MPKKKETWREVLGSGKREAFSSWTPIQKGILVIFLIGVTLAILDMSCSKVTTPPTPTTPAPKMIKE